MTDQKQIYSSLALLGEDLQIAKDVLIKINGKKIVDIETSITKQRKKDVSENFYFDNCIILPGFINGHTHIGDSFAKELGFKLKINEIVQYPKGLKHYLLEKIDENIIIDGMMNSIKEMIYSGTTTFVDFREGGINGINLLQNAINNILKINPNLKINRIILGRPKNGIEDIDNLFKYCDGIGLSSTNKYSDEELIEISKKCKKLNKIASVHVSETKEERLYTDREFNNSDVYRAILLLDANPIVHAIHITKKDMTLIKAKKRGIVVCPRANSYFGVGFPPIQEFIKENIPICIGTDNVMANSLNLFREFEYIIKYLRCIFGPKIINSIDILKMATIYPAKIFNLKNKGSLDIGKEADMIVLNLNKPHLQPFNKILEILTLRACPSDIKTIFLEGNKIVPE
ncbi:MAG: amidohydrolase family protein [Candidatus Helarchaeota archaeon]